MLHKATIIDELEVLMPRWLENKFDKLWYPNFVHCLRIDRDRMDKPNLSGLWNPEKNVMETKSDEQAHEGGASMGELNAKIDSLTTQLARIEQLMKSQNKEL